jgi:hypothetical protein
MSQSELVSARDLLAAYYGKLRRLHSKEPEILRHMEWLETESSRLSLGINRRALASDNLPPVLGDVRC